MNSTHAAWLNAAVAAILAALPSVSGAPGLPSYVGTACLLINAVLHAYLPDAPKK